jgi:tetratricopeptide (TPR) repeat protein
MNLMSLARVDEAAEAFARVEAIATASRIPKLVSLAAAMRALTSIFVLDAERAFAEGDRAVETAPDPLSAFFGHWARALVFTLFGRVHDEACAASAAALERAIGVRGLTGTAEATLAHVYFARGEVERAAQIGGRAIGSLGTWPDPIALTFALRTLGTIELARGDAAAARALFEEAIAISESTHARIDVGSTLYLLSLAHQAGGDQDGAKALAQAGRRVLEDLGLHALANATTAAGALLTAGA